MTQFRAVVLGKPIEHSRSPLLHNTGYEALSMRDWHYERQECDAEGLPATLEAFGPEVRGCSVTMPAKFAALECASSVSERAALVGSANTLLRTPEGWHADNTDIDGVLGALAELMGTQAITRACVVGAGGTARPALYALAKRGAKSVAIVNRSDRSEEFGDLAEALGVELKFSSFDQLQDALEGSDVLVSTVPAEVVAPFAQTLAQIPVLDVIYDPWPTPLMQAASALGTAFVGGYVMLAEQAYGQFEQFTGVQPPREAMRIALERDLKIH
ncbi:shikimate dehydrogenase [Corynebacterium gerontici]|uniref:shikimate dehydrogenase (NADP(+)) n=1 Tax=Corynebacterium gerontici TaxID=2079234 RepID=A0A3G6J682_9CORY|nr:shikimate dehydrogenase [Corynebacterium gerontici]AZA11524.1 Shikimate dehydrogenase [Corynebacterium gerontici]